MFLSEIKYYIFSFLLVISGVTFAQTVALSEDPNFIHASILITSKGDFVYQISGHAAIRMECPEHGFDRVFSYENNAGVNLKKHFIDGALGFLNEFDYAEYLKGIEKGGRQLTAYNLNLTLNEKARLWEVLDSLKTQPGGSFNILETHCFSIIAQALDISVSPSKIDWGRPNMLQNTFREYLLKTGVSDDQWNYLFIMLALGNYGDLNGEGTGYIYPTIFELTYKDFYIVSPDGQERPLISGEPKILTPLLKEQRPTHPTPLETSIIFLVIIVVITVLQYYRNYAKTGLILDIALWILITGGGIVIVLMTFLPYHYGGNWNWPLIVFNPLGWIPVVLYRKKLPTLRWIWFAYSTILVFFALFINLIAPSISVAWRIIAFAIAIRCLYHAYQLRGSRGRGEVLGFRR